MKFERRCADDGGHLLDNEARLVAAFRRFRQVREAHGFDVDSPEAWAAFKTVEGLRSSMVPLGGAKYACAVCGAPIVTVEVGG